MRVLAFDNSLAFWWLTNAKDLRPWLHLDEARPVSLNMVSCVEGNRTALSGGASGFSPWTINVHLEVASEKQRLRRSLLWVCSSI